MELAKVTVKGQITIPIEIRRKLGVSNGDKVLFVEEAGKIYIANPAENIFQQAEGTSVKHKGIVDAIDKMDSSNTTGGEQNG